MNRTGLTWGRVANLIPVVFGITVVSFLLIRIVPGDPVRQILGNHYTPGGARDLRHSLGLDQGLLGQYGHYMSQVVHGSFGVSYQYHENVGKLLTARLEPTLLLLVMTGVMCAVISVPLGIAAAIWRGGVLDQATRLFFTLGYALPSFLLGVFLILVFGLKLSWLPIGGYGGSFGSHLEHLLMPAVTLAIPFSTVLVRSLRASAVGVLDADFITIARLKGVSPSRLIVRHVVRNAIGPVAVVFGVNLAFLVGGTVVVENVFSIPGLGSLLVGSVSTRDYPVVQAVALVLAIFVLLVNLLTDAVHGLLDPRLAATAAAGR
jgi:ABC-type dipeptide/oligopeptide/nickel transport system permease component